MPRISLRELLLLVTLVALAIASLKYASELWLAIVAGLAMIAFFVTGIVAVVDRGPRQAFAIGFALTMIAYGLMLTSGQNTQGPRGNVSSKNIEFHPWKGRLPTTRLLRYAHMVVNEPQQETWGGGGFPMRTTMVEHPRREVFMPVGHCWWALLLGYLGGRFALFVYVRRMRESTQLAAESS
jgi:hypothetical protein